jgi:hypothetical protein
MVITADGKGVPMRRPEEDGPKPHHRWTKGKEASKKRMACVGALFSIEPLVRRANDILDEVLRDKEAKERPRRSTSACGRNSPWRSADAGRISGA